MKGGKDFYLAYCPERAIPSDTLNEMVNNHRTVGGFNKESVELAKDLYSCFVKGNLYSTTLRTAGMVKLIENTYRDINKALANEFASIAEKMGVNIWETSVIIQDHPFGLLY